jgi:60 kDa SS-A/Ro ribonucleoprotein
MVNRSLFTSTPGSKAPVLPVTSTGDVTRNEAGGAAFHFGPEHALAQLAATGTFNNTFYGTAEDQLLKLKELLPLVTPEYVAKLAVFSRSHGHMKDMPANLVAWLYARAAGTDPLAAEFRQFFRIVFPKVIDNGKMLLNFIQIVRSGVWGRKALATLGSKAVESWFNSRTPTQIFLQSVGARPSMNDVLRLCHVVPKNEEYAALYAYLCGEPLDVETPPRNGLPARKVQPKKEHLPSIVQAYEEFKLARLNVTTVRADLDRAAAQLVAHLATGGRDYTTASAKMLLERELVRLEEMAPPALPFEMLTALPLTEKDWASIALNNGGWQFVCKNLNTFARHGVFKDLANVEKVAARLRDADAIRKARVMPYQVLAAYKHAGPTMPRPIVDALHDALEVAVKNVPALPGNVYVFVDVSGSMGSAVTGYRQGATSNMTVLDAAAMFGVALLRTCPNAQLVPVDTTVHTDFRLEPRDSVLTNAVKLAAFQGGGTRLDEALAWLVTTKKAVDTVIFFSDNESWMAAPQTFRSGRTTAMAANWELLRKQNPKAKMVCVDVQPNAHTQLPDRNDVLNVGGFSDAIWPVIEAFVSGKDADFWVDVIKKTVI